MNSPETPSPFGSSLSRTDAQGSGQARTEREGGTPRTDWTRAEIAALFDLPFPDLLHRAATVHRAHFDPAEVQVSTLLSVKTGGCPEDCAYCPQAQRYDTGVAAQKLMDAEQVLANVNAPPPAPPANNAGASTNAAATPLGAIPPMTPASSIGGDLL